MKMKLGFGACLFLLFVGTLFAAPADAHFSDSKGNTLAINENEQKFQPVFGSELWTDKKGYQAGFNYFLSKQSKVGLYYAIFSDSPLDSSVSLFADFPLILSRPNGWGVKAQVTSLLFNQGSRKGVLGVGSLLGSLQLGKWLFFSGLHVPLIRDFSRTTLAVSSDEYSVMGAEFYINDWANLYASVQQDTVSVGVSIKGIPIAIMQNETNRALSFGHPFQRYQFDLN
ncbi:MAG: hypothetical protein ACI9BD_000656 [Candidatus Marinamargulisbacteria bacterium]|jgi:hypothetical protein